MNWIPCAERLPDVYENVLFTYGNGMVFAGYMDESRKWRYSSGVVVGKPATHWMDFPEPPA